MISPFYEIGAILGALSLSSQIYVMFFKRYRGEEYYSWLFWVTLPLPLINTLFIADSIVTHDTTERVIQSIFLVINILCIIYLKRRKPPGKKRVRKLVGAKAKALKDALVKNARKLGDYMPSPQPVPA